jgi:hypothetical protein
MHNIACQTPDRGPASAGSTRASQAPHLDEADVHACGDRHARADVQLELGALGIVRDERGVVHAAKVHRVGVRHRRAVGLDLGADRDAGGREAAWRGAKEGLGERACLAQSTRLHRGRLPRSGMEVGGSLPGQHNRLEAI